MPEIYSREHIYELVWSKAMRHVGPELGISDVALKKICVKHRIPTPPRGYWARKAAGHSVRRSPLNPIDEPELQGVRIDREYHDRSASTARSLAHQVEDENLRSLIEFENSPANKIIVPQSVNSFHPLAEAVRTSLKAAAKGTHSTLLVAKPEVGLSTNVSRDCVFRSVKIIHAFVQAFLARGHKLKSTESTGTRFVVLAEPFQLEIRERQRMIRIASDDRWPRVEHEPSGKLLLILSDNNGNHLKTWGDSASRKLEDILNSVLVWMLLSVEKLRKDREETARREQEWEKKRIKQIEEETVRQRDTRNVQQLLELGRSLHSIRALQHLVQSLQDRMNEMNPDDPNRIKIAKWLDLATPYIQRLDPLSNLDALPKLLSHESPESIPVWRSL